MLTAEGHAGFNKKGGDIVCAAVSVLCFTLLECVKDEQSSGRAKIIRSAVSDGSFTLEAEPYDFARERFNAIFETVLSGLWLIAEQYPDYVKFE